MAANGDVVVVGAGPAGMAAAVQLARMGIACTVCERRRPGGMLWNAQRVENYPGFPDGIPGAELAELFRRQFERWVCSWHRSQVRSLEWSGERFHARTDAGEFRSAFAVVASGTAAKAAAGIAIDAAAAERISCDVAAMTDVCGRTVLVVGGGDAAYDYALTLAERNEVLLLQRQARSRALTLLQERVAAHARIRLIREVHVRSIQATAGGRLAAQLTGADPATAEIRADRVLLALGREPELSFLSPALRASRASLSQRGRLQLVGDVRRGLHRQVAIAVGDGVRAAMEIAAAMQRGG